MPVGIIRPIFSKGSNKQIINSFLCMFYNVNPFTTAQEKIIRLIKESKYYASSSNWNCDTPTYFKISSIQRNIIENNPKSLYIEDLSKSASLSRPYLSTSFKKIT